MGLLKTLLFILLFYYGFKIISRLFAPLFLKFVVKKAAQKFGNNTYHQNQSKHKEGEVIIDRTRVQKKTNSSIGEYVDFEEID